MSRGLFKHFCMIFSRLCGWFLIYITLSASTSWSSAKIAASHIEAPSLNESGILYIWCIPELIKASILLSLSTNIVFRSDDLDQCVMIFEQCLIHKMMLYEYRFLRFSQQSIRYLNGALAEWLTRCPAKAISSEACVRITQASILLLSFCRLVISEVGSNGILPPTGIPATHYHNH